MNSHQRTQGCRARARVRGSRFIVGVAAVAALAGAATPASVSHAATDDSASAAQPDSQSAPDADPPTEAKLPVAVVDGFPDDADPKKPFVTVPLGTKWRFDGSPSRTFDYTNLEYHWWSSDDSSFSLYNYYDKAFNKLGLTKIALRVTDYRGRWDTQVIYFNVVAKTDAQVSIANFDGTVPIDRTVPVGTKMRWRSSFSNVSGSDLYRAVFWSPTGVRLEPGGQEYGSDRSFEQTYNKPGTYYVYAQDHTQYGPGGSAVAQIVVTKPDGSHAPELKMNPALDQRVLVGQPVTIDVSQSIDLDGDPLSFYWLLDNQLVDSVAPSLTRTFDKPGVHVFKARVRAYGDETWEWRRISVELPQRPPVAAFNPSGNPTVALGSTLTFDGAVSRDPDGQSLHYEWTMDGSDQTSTDVKFTPTFTKPGKFRVTLKVTDPDDLSSEYSTTVNVPENKAPVADFSVPSSIVSGQQVSFDGSSSRDPDGDALTYEWRVRYANGVVGTSKVLNYTFPKAGKYGVQLTVKDRLGVTSVKWVEVTVTSTNKPPVANFTVPSKITVGTAVSFDGSSSRDPDGDALTYEWRVRYANGVVSKSKVLEYKFPKAGLYGVQLTVKDPSGASSVKWVEVTVTATNKAPVADFKAPSSISSGQNVSFDGSSSRDPDGDALSYEWRVRYANGVVGTSKVLDYKFPKAGLYGVELTVKDPSGASSKKWVEVSVK